MRLTDIHCHLLPDIDDGPDTIEEAKNLLRDMRAQGVWRIIVTPHYRPEMFEAPVEKIQRYFNRMQKIAASGGILLYLGCEHYRYPEITEVLLEQNHLTMNYTEYVLIEFMPYDTFQTIRNYVHSLCSCGFKPIIAHVERYDCCWNIECLEELIEVGASLQINAGSILGKSGAKVKRFCIKLMKADMVDFIASDTHNRTSRKPNLGKCADYVEKKFGKEYAYKVFVQNPEKIIQTGDCDGKGRNETRASELWRKRSVKDAAY